MGAEWAAGAQVSTWRVRVERHKGAVVLGCLVPPPVPAPGFARALVRAGGGGAETRRAAARDAGDGRATRPRAAREREGRARGGGQRRGEGQSSRGGGLFSEEGG